jgi:hypothetical protein
MNQILIAVLGSKDCASVVVGYLTPLPKLRYLSELEFATRRIYTSLQDVDRWRCLQQRDGWRIARAKAFYGAKKLVPPVWTVLFKYGSGLPQDEYEARLYTRMPVKNFECSAARSEL